MVQWFLPGFLACTHQFKTQLTSGILLGASLGWGALRFFLYCKFGSVPDLVLCFERQSLNHTIHSFHDCARKHINSYVGYMLL